MKRMIIGAGLLAVLAGCTYVDPGSNYAQPGAGYVQQPAQYGYVQQPTQYGYVQQQPTYYQATPAPVATTGYRDGSYERERQAYEYGRRDGSTQGWR